VIGHGETGNLAEELTSVPEQALARSGGLLAIVQREPGGAIDENDAGADPGAAGAA